MSVPTPAAGGHVTRATAAAAAAAAALSAGLGNPAAPGGDEEQDALPQPMDDDAGDAGAAPAADGAADPRVNGASASASGAPSGASAAAPARSSAADGSSLAAALVVDGDESKQPAAPAPRVSDAAKLAAMELNVRSLKQRLAAQDVAMAHAKLAAARAHQAIVDPDEAVDAAAPQSATMDMFAALVRGMKESQEQQIAAMKQMAAQQASAATAALVLKALGDLPTFSGKGVDTTLTAEDWLQRSEDYYAARERALGITAEQGDEARVLESTNALTDDARRWLISLQMRPRDWPSLCAGIRGRFCSVPASRIRLDKLHALVKKSLPGRSKYTLQGLQMYTTAFLQQAGEIPDSYFTLNSKLALLAEGLPERSAEHVMKEEAKVPPTPLHLVVADVIQRATFKDHVSSMHAAASSASAAPITLDDVTRAVNAFGCTRDEAAGVYTREEEGWAPHDTHGAQQASWRNTGSSSVSPPPSSAQAQIDQLVLSALARVGAGQAARDRHQSGSQSSTRRVPSGVREEVPQELANSRVSAGLCIKCGVAKYEPGHHGHNSRTCKAPADKTTSAAEGRRKANF